MNGSTLSICKSNVNEGAMIATITALTAANSRKMERVEQWERAHLGVATTVRSFTLGKW